MIHGIVGTLAGWHLRIVPMLWNDFQVLTYDLRGHGYSDITETGYTPTQLATDLKELLDRLDIEQTDLVGHSMGADIALYFAYMYPERVRKAVLIEPIVPAVMPMMTKEDFEGKEWVAEVLDTLGIPIPEDRRLDSDFMLKESSRLQNRWGPLKGMPWRKAHSDRIEQVLTKTSILKDAVEIGELTIENIPKINVPIHLIYDSGSFMWSKSQKFLLDNLPDVTSSVIKSGTRTLSHFALHEQPELIGQLILDALRGPGPGDNRPLIEQRQH
ncbi:MAG: alpha/beta hydrolase [Actinomycetota bacterium]